RETVPIPPSPSCSRSLQGPRRLPTVSCRAVALAMAAKWAVFEPRAGLYSTRGVPNPRLAFQRQGPHKWRLRERSLWTWPCETHLEKEPDDAKVHEQSHDAGRRLETRAG